MLEAKKLNVENSKYQYRVKAMNAVEALSIQTQIMANKTDNILKSYYLVLESVEVLAGDTWIAVKDKGVLDFHPLGIEDDQKEISAIADAFMEEYLKPIFQKSNE